MLAILLAAIIANGFIILRFSSSQFYKLHRYDGQLLYIKATWLGLIATGSAFFIDACFGAINCINKLLPNNGIASLFKTEHLNEYFIFFVFSILLSVSYCLLEMALLTSWISTAIVPFISA